MHLLSEASGGLALIFRRWATKKTAGSTKNGRDSKPKNLGVKKFGGEVYDIELLLSYYVVHLLDFFFNLKFPSFICLFVCFAESDSWEHHRSPTGYSVPPWELCWDGKGSHFICPERRECAVRTPQAERPQVGACWSQGGSCSSSHLCRCCYQTWCREPVMLVIISIQPGRSW